MSLLNVYAPPGSGWSFYRQMIELMISKGQGTIICRGDINTRLIPKLDSSRGNPDFSGISKKINNLMKETGIIDVWREIYPSGWDYTHYSSPHGTYSRIDYFLIFKSDLHRVVHCDIGPIALSDHSPIYMSIHLNNKPRMTSWRLNSNILNNTQIKKEIGNEIKVYLELNNNGEVGPPVLWDALKAVMRGRIISITSHKKKLRQQRLKNLEDRLKQL